jgi:hypothetical protein
VIEAVADTNPNTIVVLETGNPAAMPWRDKVSAVLEAWYPGQAGGQRSPPAKEYVALQAAESVRVAQSQVAEQLDAEVHPDAIGRGIAEQIGLACRISPVAAARRLTTST